MIKLENITIIPIIFGVIIETIRRLLRKIIALKLIILIFNRIFLHTQVFASHS